MQSRMAMCHGKDCKSKGKKHLNLQMTKEGGRYYCEPCLVKFKKQKAHMYGLYNFIAKESHITYPTGRMLKQIKDLTERGYTYFGIHQSLIYMIDVKNKSVANNYFLGYVPYIYEEAKQWYIENRNERKQRSANGYTKPKQPTKIDFNYQQNSNKSKDLIAADGLLD